jgi:hypothetical protein
VNNNNNKKLPKSGSTKSFEVSNSTNISDLWISTLEQGIIPLFQTVLQGFPINNHLGLSEKITSSSDKNQQILIFPEPVIRQKILFFFKSLVFHLENQDLLRQRIGQSLIYSGNSKLRMNVLTSLLVITNYSVSLGR